jgi:hypothetical protein
VLLADMRERETVKKVGDTDGVADTDRVADGDGGLRVTLAEKEADDEMLLVMLTVALADTDADNERLGVTLGGADTVSERLGVKDADAEADCDGLVDRAG